MAVSNHAMWLLTVALGGSLFDVVDGKCNPGVVLPVWTPQENLSSGETTMRGIAYFLAMMYLFLGVSIISDRFMEAIEVITSKEKEIKVKLPNGGAQIVVARVWNETVANLTLMALGSSAPEILLSIIEILGKLLKGDFESGSGELGPGTIVGSAAFNLLCIIAICIYVIPDGEVRSIKHLNVFFVTATWSVFAYIWLFLILKVFSPGIVDIWEGVVTFMFFPLTVATAYIADRRMYEFSRKTYRLDKRGIIVEGERVSFDATMESDLQIFPEEATDENVRNFEQTRRDYIQLLRKLRKKFPSKEPEELEQLTKEEIYKRGPKSRAFYRMQATRKLIAAAGMFRKSNESITPLPSLKIRKQSDGIEGVFETLPPNVTGVYFNPGHYTVMETVDSFEVTVCRRGGDLNHIVMVDYRTEDGSATADSDYAPISGALTFSPGETHKTIRIKILDDNIYEEDEHFYIHLSRARFGQPRNPAKAAGIQSYSAIDSADNCKVMLIDPWSATVVILDDDHAGVFAFTEKDVLTTESIGKVELKVKRWVGARGVVQLSYNTIDGTAKADKDYKSVHGKLLFQNSEIEKTFEVPIINQDTYQKDVLFYVQISHPVPLDENGAPIPHISKTKDEMTKLELIALEGWPKLSPENRCQIRLRESKQFKGTIDKLLQRANARLVIGTSSWKEQFIKAVKIGDDDDSNDGDDGDDGDDDDDEGEGDDKEEKEPKYPSFGEYVMHFLTIFWKVLFAFVPPTDMCGGYLAFFVSILVIGVLTAIIGDLAAHFGCTVGLKDSVTAITFVALGTSIPDTFASKVSAIQDEYADASIGNVTGSNAVNVFLGIGIAWTIAPIFYAFRTCAPGHAECTTFYVDPGSLAFSVTLFCTCAVVAIVVILLRRLPVLGGGELGGPARFKYSTALLFIALWIFYVLMSSLEAYGKVQGF